MVSETSLPGVEPELVGKARQETDGVFGYDRRYNRESNDKDNRYADKTNYLLPRYGTYYEHYQYRYEYYYSL